MSATLAAAPVAAPRSTIPVREMANADRSTHQLVEHSAAPRVVPNLRVFRPPDGVATSVLRLLGRGKENQGEGG